MIDRAAVDYWRRGMAVWQPAYAVSFVWLPGAWFPVMVIAMR